MTTTDVIKDEPTPQPGTDPEGRPPSGLLATVVRQVRSNIRQYGMVVALLLIVVLFEILTDGILLRPLNVTNLIMQNGYILVLAIGMMLVIINGHIDLSVGSVAAFVGGITGVMIVQWQLPWPLALVIALAVGGLIGAFHGFWIAYMAIPSFIVTLAGMLLFRGLTLVILEGRSIAPFPDGFRDIATGFIPNMGSAGELHGLTLLLGVAVSVAVAWVEWRARRRRASFGLDPGSVLWFALRIGAVVVVINAFTYVLAGHAGMPIVGLVLLALITAYSFVMNRAVLGRHIYAGGGNAKAAELSGIKTKRTTFLVFVNMGTLAALAGLIFAARLNAATPKAGHELRAGRDRGGVHRRGVGRRRRRHRRRRDHRRPRDGRDEQRHVADRPEHRLVAGHQGPASCSPRSPSTSTASPSPSRRAHIVA